MKDYLTTREVADLLRLGERKIYELVADGAIPVSRATGKLLFPRDLIDAWVRQQVDYRGDIETLSPPPPVVAGSHDPLLDWAIRESGCGLAVYFDGSLDGLKRMARGEAIAAGTHLFEAEHEDWNRQHIADLFPGQPVVAIEWARRQQGLIVAPGNPLRLQRAADLGGRRVIARQPGAGSQVLLDHLLDRAGLDSGDAELLDSPARSESDVARAVAEGRADAGLGIASVARQYRLDFVPLCEERYDLVVWRRAYFEPAWQRLMALGKSPSLSARAEGLGGYSLGGNGDIRYNAH